MTPVPTRFLCVAGRNAHRRGAGPQAQPDGFRHHIRIRRDAPPGALGVRQDDHPISPADKPFHAPQQTNSLSNLCSRILAFDHGDGDLLVGDLSAGGEQYVSAHDASQQCGLLQEFASFDHVLLSLISG